ncbi:hypothetical protein TWF569_009975 [Orbilia oligospora]|uniref:Chromatin associated protein KTI12 n=1 Tax=Orbilia oligospora TaxID=2813651 RepID=A0A7C8N632_ORBOL|nr:hypothetical protein TWF103_001699 [Orbilia oligospora]KAF3088674.1 hypothetical protein TWF706_010680 [Orbilia oligospora]KAF3094423.1 hypothetical protein TWF102_007544 [Orbilia oligospora]KAF3120264.1 hypothetical protein TWF594_003932 [Orbilia oligospora]KAF3135312.1 hypothetical protein TWF569_009975 [Orbilia oligospora]
MPLIMMSGFPASGKTTRANQIRDFFNSKIAELSPTDPRVARLKLHVVSDEGLGVSKEVYREARPEKDARATFYGAVKRLLSADDIVIADGMNYIKGYRYQLHCESKALLTPSCVVYVGTPAEKCKEWNTAKGSEKREGGEETGGGEGKGHSWEAYAPDVLDNLIFRYEEPNGMTRWDSPLFVVPWMDEDIPGEEIWNAMVNNEAVKPHLATVLKPAAEANYLQILDKTTQDVVSAVLEYQKTNGAGGSVKISEASTVCSLHHKGPVKNP